MSSCVTIVVVPGDGGSNIGVIIGAVFGGIVLGAVCCALVMYFIQKRSTGEVFCCVDKSIKECKEFNIQH